MSRRAWVPPGPNAAHRCHCGGGWFNPRYFAECASCRTAYVAAIKAVREVLGGRIVGAPNIPVQP